MPSVANMSLIWNDIGSYIKSSFGGDRENENASKNQPKEEIEVKSEFSDEKHSLNKIEAKPSAQKEANDQSINHQGEKLESEKLKLIVVDKNIDSPPETSKSRMSTQDSKRDQCSSLSTDETKGNTPKDKNELPESTENDDDNQSNDTDAVEENVNNDSDSAKLEKLQENKELSGKPADVDKNKYCDKKSELPVNSSKDSDYDNATKQPCSESETNNLTEQKEKAKENMTQSNVFKHDKQKALDSVSNDTKESKQKASNEKNINHKDTPLHSRTVRDAGSASRSSSLLGQKRSSSKSVSRKSDYGKRALSLSDVDKETSEDESDSENESNENKDKIKSKKEEKSTLKKRRKEIKSCQDNKSKEDTDNESAKQESGVKDVTLISSRKKSKAGAKRKPTDLSSESLDDELEEIKRCKYIVSLLIFSYRGYFLYDENGKLNYNYVILVKHGDLESDEDSSETHDSQSDQSDSDEDGDENALHLLPTIKPPDTVDSNKTIDEPDALTSTQPIQNKFVDNTRPLVSFNLSSITSDEPYNSILSAVPASLEHNELCKETIIEKESESEITKEFNDVSKLREDQKKCMKRAKDLLKAAFSESESDSDDSDTEINHPLAQNNANEVEVIDDDVELS